MTAAPGGLGGAPVNGPFGSGGNVDAIAQRLGEMTTNSTNLVQQLGKLISTLTTVLPFGGGFGSFTMGASASATVNDANVQAGSVILLMPTNASAGTLQGSNESLYVSNRTAGVSFAVTTAAGTAAAGTETFSYVIVNPS